MCGIAGFVGAYDSELLRAMLGAIEHRGPDDVGEWISSDRTIGLGHRRLAILDLSKLGHQPMVDPAAQAIIVFNGEIYNFRQLRAQLEAEGYSFRSNSDTEVLLSLYQARGVKMLDDLNGIFAFAIYDQSKQSLFAACDASGVKPLYFIDGQRGFLFASELKALLVCPDVRRELDPFALSRYLAFLWSPGGSTPFRNISRLGPGQALIVKAGSALKRWQWAASAWSGGADYVDDSDAIRSVEEGLRTAVQRQMISDVPVGAFLSGGLDSSAVVAMAREISPDIDCFTIDAGPAHDDGTAADLPFARQVARHLRVKLHEVRVDSSRMASDLERMVFQLDEPLADPACLNVLYISELARQHGIKVLLSGAGGDDLFSGYRRHRAVMLERYWAWLPKTARHLIREASSSLDQGSSIGRRVAKAFAYSDLLPQERLIGYFQWADPRTVVGLFRPELRQEISERSIAQPMDDYLAQLPVDLHPLNRMLALEQRFFLSDHNLLYTDKMSMAVGVEVRVPFLDKDFVRLANGLGPSLKQRGAVGKWVLKKAMRPYLPSQVICRAKTGFGVPLRRWLRHELRHWVRELLSESSIRSRGIFDPQAVTKLLASDRAGHVDAAYTILGLVCIEIWCRRFVDVASPAAKSTVEGSMSISD